MIHAAARLALGPILLAQARRVRSNALALPEPQGPREGRVGDGGVVLRILVAGDSSAAGVGARTQDEALALPLARLLSQRLAGAVGWQLAAQTGLTSEGVLRKLMQDDVREADIAIVIVGVNDITREVPLSAVLRTRGEIARWLLGHARVRHVAFAAVPEMDLFPALPQPLAWLAGKLARRNNVAQAQWAKGIERVSHVPMDGVMRADLMAADGFHPAPALYARTAARLSDYLHGELPSIASNKESP